MKYLAQATQNPLLPDLTELIIGAVSFLIVFGVMAKVLMPRITKTLAERTDTIEGGIERAEKLQAEAQREIEQYRAQLAEARHEAARLREEAKEQAAQIIAESREKATSRVPAAGRRGRGGDRGRPAAGAELAAYRGWLDGGRAGQPGRRRVPRRTRPGSAGRWTGSWPSSSRQSGPAAEVRAGSMRGASRASLAEAKDRLAAVAATDAGSAGRLGDELFAVTHVLDGEPALRRDRCPSRPGDAQAQAALARQLFGGKVGHADPRRW